MMTRWPHPSSSLSPNNRHSVRLLPAEQQIFDLHSIIESRICFVFRRRRILMNVRVHHVRSAVLAGPVCGGRHAAK